MRLGDAVTLLREHGAENRSRFDTAASERGEVGGHHAHVDLARQNVARGAVDSRRDDGFDERGDDEVGRRHIERPVQRDNSAKGRETVGVARAKIGLRERVAGGGAAWVRVLDHHRGGLVEFQHESRGRVQIEQVGVGQFLALQDRRLAQAGGGRLDGPAIPRRLLMRVLAVAEVADLVERKFQAGGQSPGIPTTLESIAGDFDGRERRRNRRIVGRGVGDCLAGELVPERQARRLVDGREQARVVGGIDDDENAAKILGGRAHQRRSADIDLLDERVERGRRVGRRFHERVQVDHDEVDEAQPVALELGHIVGPIAPRENAAVKRRMQRFHASVHHLREAGEVRHAPHGEPRAGKCPCGAAGRYQLKPARDQAASEIGNTGLVRNAQQGPWHNGTSPVSFLTTPGPPGAAR